jgi:DNA-binding transcriptional ArsR family regulator
MAEPSRIRLSAQTLRGIAHPLRVRLLGLLREEGPSTATRLAERTGQSSGATSYHLRQLAAYGFVVEDDTREMGGGRERWWRAAHEASALDAEHAREAPVEAEAYMRAIANEYADRVDRFLDGAAVLPPEWDSAMTLSDFRLRLRPDEAIRLLAELEAVVVAYRREDRAEPAPPGTERVVVQIQVLPFVRADMTGREEADQRTGQADQRAAEADQ